eukprot:1766141-Pyramimonas_sp.AAC.1
MKLAFHKDSRAAATDILNVKQHMAKITVIQAHELDRGESANLGAPPDSNIAQAQPPPCQKLSALAVLGDDAFETTFHLNSDYTDRIERVPGEVLGTDGILASWGSHCGEGAGVGKAKSLLCVRSQAGNAHPADADNNEGAVGTSA